jgi:hypothetical protein
MAVGDSALIGGDSYLAIAREKVYGTYLTGTAALNFTSCNLKLTQENKIVEQIEAARVWSKQIQQSRHVEGDLEYYYQPIEDAPNFILQNAFGGSLTSTTATGETVGGAAMTHTFKIGSVNNMSYTALSINMRKGGAVAPGPKVFEYKGLRVNQLTISADVDDGLMMKASLVGADGSVTTNDISANITAGASPILNFDAGRFSIEGTLASLTSASFWHVQSLEIGINNNLNSDAEARRIGSSTLVVLPPGIAELSLKATIRFDTLTAYTAMLNSTQLSAEAEFLGPTMSGSSIRQGIKFTFPRVFISDAGEPEVSDASGVLQSEVVFNVLRDDTSATGYALRALVTNNKASYE